MKIIAKLIYSVIIAIALSACAGGPEIQKETVKDIRTQVVSIPDALLEPCFVTKPPNRDNYVYAESDAVRLDIMVTYSVDLLKDLAKCNNRLLQIRTLQDKQKGIYKSTLENR